MSRASGRIWRSGFRKRAEFGPFARTWQFDVGVAAKQCEEADGRGRRS